MQIAAGEPTDACPLSLSESRKLTLQKEEDTIEFIIQDHGQGFDLNAVYSLKGSEKGLGLAGMKERTLLSGGSFAIESTQGIGTTIRASWPVSV